MTFASGISYNTIEIIDCLVLGRDYQTGRALHEHLQNLPLTSGPRVRRHCITSEADFWACLDEIEAQCEIGWKPWLHFEAHAGKAGLEVPDPENPKGVILPWSILVDPLRRINVASEFNLGVFVAACEGIEAIRPMTIKKPAPYMFLIGPSSAIPAEDVECASKDFYNAILKGTDLNKATRQLPRTFITFLAERFFTSTYARVLRAQSIGRRRLERVDTLVNMVLPTDNAPPEQLKVVRDAAKLHSRPDRERFEAALSAYLPGGVSYDFDELVEFVRAGGKPK